MNVSYDHGLMASFCLYLDYKLCAENGAFFNVTGSLYRITNNRISGFNIYASPYKQWVYDSSVSGATVLSGVYINNTYITRGTSGLAIDYLRGRVYLDSAVNVTSISGAYSVKEFNVIPTSTDETKLLMNSEFTNWREALKSPTGIAENVIPVPAIFTKIYPGENEPYEFGGARLTNSSIRNVVICDDRDGYYLDGALAAMRDLDNKYFALFSAQELPFTVYGDLKTSGFNYCSVADQKFDNGQIVFISRSYTSKFGAEAASKINFKAIAGFCDIELQGVR